MSSLFPPGFILLVSSGYLVRILNRRPPFWERLFNGLRYYDEPRAQDVEAVLKQAIVAPPLSGRAQVIAGESLDLRLRCIPWSYFPLQSVPWGNLIGVEGLGMTVVTALYAIMGFILVQAWVRVFRCYMYGCVW